MGPSAEFPTGLCPMRRGERVSEVLGPALWCVGARIGNHRLDLAEFRDEEDPRHSCGSDVGKRLAGFLRRRAIGSDGDWDAVNGRFGAGPTSVLLRFYPRTTGTRQVFLADSTSAGARQPACSRTTKPAGITRDLSVRSTTTRAPLTSVQPMVLNAWNVAVLTVRPAAPRVTLYLNGLWQAEEYCLVAAY